MIKKHFSEELVMTKEDNEDSENSTNCWFCGNDYVDNYVKSFKSIIISVKTIEVLRIETVMSILN